MTSPSDSLNRPHLRQLADGMIVLPADGGFPGSRGLGGDVVGGRIETGGVVGQDEIEVGDIDM